MSGIDYRPLYDGYWRRQDRWGSHSFTDADALAEQILSVCGGGSVLDVGCGMGGLVRALLRRGVDAHGIDVAAPPIEHLGKIAPGRFHLGNILKLPFADDAFDTLICTDVMEHLDEADVPQAIRELYRVARRAVFLTIATAPDRDNRWHLCIHDRPWWETQFLEAGFRKHPRGQVVLGYEALEHQGSPITVILEKIPPAVVEQYPLEALRPERDLHMDMLRESGRRADAHEARYHLACPFVRPGDVVLDVSCGLGYGAAILHHNTPLARVIGVDSSAYAIDYARANYGREGIEFHQRDAADLSFLPDHSVDYVVSMETLEHLADPEAFLEEVRRVLRPGGRIMVSVPNEWVDETGHDPNPHHLHVYTWSRLRKQIERHFMLERAYAQTCGGSIKLTDRPRGLRQVPLDEAPRAEAEWWLALAMKDPVGFDRKGYRETSFPDHSSNENYHITAFGRDYDNPWLVKGMVSIGMRTVDPAALERMAWKVLDCARPGSADAGAALCILAYRLLEDPGLTAAKVDRFLPRIEAYQEAADDSAHAWRWRISMLYVAGMLQLAVGRNQAARELFLRCAGLDCLRFSPLLATKTVDALYQAGLIAASSGDVTAAADHWQAALREAHRVLSGDWLNIWGSPDRVVEFGLPEATQVLDLATRCGYALVALPHWPARPGYAWVQAQRNQARDLARWRKQSEDQHAAILYLQRTISDLNQQIGQHVQTISVTQQQLQEQSQASAALGQTLEDLRRQMQELIDTLARREQELADQQRRGAELTAAIEAATQREQALAAQLSQKEADYHAQIEHWRSQHAELQKRFDELHAWTEKLDAAHAEHCSQLIQYRNRMEEIERSTGWALLQAGYRARFLLFPRGSRRERAARWTMHKFRGLRDRSRYGPRCVAAWLWNGVVRRFHELTGTAPPAPPPGPSTVPAQPASPPPIRGEVVFAGQQNGLVSVILPVYNQANLLRDSIESVLAQTYPHFELIVLNDGSTDGVEAVLDAYVGHPKIRILTQRNQKLPKALSNAFDFARGEFWTWTSADNLMEPQQLEKQVNFLRAHPEVAMVYCDYLAIDDRGELLRDPNFRPHNRRTPDSPEIRIPRDTSQLNTVQDNYIGACFMYRGWVGRLLGDYLPSLGVEDYDYWMRINNLFPIRHIGTDDLLYRYRVHDNTLNAQAQQHSIYDRVQRLMEYEAHRRWFFDEPWLVLVDAATESWLSRMDTGKHRIQRIDPDQPLACGFKVLILVHADTLPVIAGKSLPQQSCVVAWFGDDARAPYRYSPEIQSVAHLCCASNRRVLDRLGLLTRHAFAVEPGPALFQLASAFANNRLFATKSVPVEDWMRTLPEVYRPSARRTRVLFQVQNFTQGGLEQVILDVMATLDPARFETYLLILGEEGPAAEKARQRGFNILRLADGPPESAYRQLLLDRQIDVVNAHYSLFGAAIAHELKIPFVQTIHNSYVWLSEEDRKAHRAADPFTTGYICVSNTVAAYASVAMGLPAGKMIVVPNGIDVKAMDAARERLNREQVRAELGYSPEDFVFLCTASITDAKAQHLLVQALAQALLRRPNIRVALLGRPLDPVYAERYAQRVRDEIEQAGIGHAVKFLGYHPDPQKFYYVADAFVLPSFVEGWSLALAEALYAGLPVVASNVGSSLELLSRTGGHVLELPCGSLLDVDAARFYQLLNEPHPEYVQAIADALVDTATRPRPPVLAAAMRRSFDREVAFRPYARIFEWLAAGGDFGAVCVWRPTYSADDAVAEESVSIRSQGRSGSANGELFHPSEQNIEDICRRARTSEGAVIFLRSILWCNYLFQRPHHLARCLARRGYTVIYDDSERITGFVGFREVEPNLYLFRGSRDLLHRVPDPILWAFCYNYHHRDGFDGDVRVVYDLIDDFSVHPYDRELMQRNHERALREADVVAYVARHLEPLVESRPDRLYLPNGVEDAFFARTDVQMPADRQMHRILREGRPIAGYYGALAKWFDYDLVEQTARLLPDWNFVLIGVDYDGSIGNRRMLKCPNVRWIGPRDYAVLPAYLRTFDVATIPFVINEITRATSPLKLYEYFAGGKPVVTSPMPECMAYPEVRIARTPEAFAAALEAAREQGRDPLFQARLREIARENSWEQRVEALEEALTVMRV